MLRRVACVLAVALSGCSEHEFVPAAPVVSESEDTAAFCRPGDPKLDVLFVIDDSASMAREAMVLASALPHIGAFLSGPVACPFELRVALTTTSTCEGEAGSFVATSCRERLADFVVDDSSEALGADVRDAACTDVCSFDSIGLEPSHVEGSAVPIRRPWVQAGRYGNLAEDIAFADALACMVPVGLSGCSHETPLLALQSALERSRDRNDPQHGFLRSDASLFVVIVTDEDEPAGDVSSWVKMMHMIESEKRATNPDAEVLVAMIGSVAVGYESGHIEDVTGCIVGDEFTPPATNLAQFIAKVGDEDERYAYSSCSDDYTVAVNPVASVIRDRLVPTCLPFCVADGDPSTPALDPVCHVSRTEIVSDAGIVETIEEPLHPCLPDGAGSWLPPPGELRCLQFVGDHDVDPVCADNGWNAESRLVSFAPSAPLGHQCIEVTCRVSLTPEIDCPDL